MKMAKAWVLAILGMGLVPMSVWAQDAGSGLETEQVFENIAPTSWAKASNFELRTAFYLRATQATAMCAAQGALGTAQAVASQLPIAPMFVTDWQQKFDRWMYKKKAPQLRDQLERNGCTIENENIRRIRDEALAQNPEGQGAVAITGGTLVSVLFDLGKGVYQLATVPYDANRDYFETSKGAYIISQSLLVRQIGRDSACGQIVESMADIVAEMRHRDMVEFKTGLKFWDEPSEVSLICAKEKGN